MAGPGGAEVGRVSVKVVPDTSRFASELRSQLKKLEKQLNISVPVELDTAAAKAEARAMKQSIESDDIEVDVDLDTDQAQASVMSLRQRVENATKDIRTNLTKISKSALKSVKGFSAMSRAAWIATAAVSLAAPALALIAGLMAGLPSLLFAAGAGIAAIGLGMEGIKRAAEVLSPAIERMKATLSATFEAGLTPVFQQLNSLMPTLEAGLNRVALGLIPMAQAFTNVVTSAQGLKQIETILTNVGTFFSSLTPMVENFTSSFLTLSTAGSNSFGLLAKTLNAFSQQFNQMTQRITSNGDFSKAMQGLAVVTRALLDVFTRLFEAGVKAMGQLGGPMATFIQGFGDALVALMPTLTNIASILMNALGKTLQFIAPYLEKLAPLLTGVGIALLALGPAAKVVMLLVKAFKAVVAVMRILRVVFLTNPFGIIIAAVALAAYFIYTYWDQIVAFLIATWNWIKQIAITTWTAISNFFIGIWNWIKNTAITAWNAIKAFFVGIWTSTKNTAIAIWNSVVAFFAGIWNWIRSTAIAAWNAIRNGITTTNQTIRNIVMSVWNAIVGFVVGVWNRIRSSAIAAWNAITGAIRGAINTVRNVVTNGFNTVVGFVRSIPGRILGALGNLGSLLWNAGKSLIQGFINGIKSMISSAVNAVSGVVSRVRGFFPFSPAKEGPFSGKGYTLYSGRALAEDFAKGISDSAPDAVRAVEKMMAAANGTATTEWNGHITNEGFGNAKNAVFDGVMAAFNGSRLQVDGNGMAKLVNGINARNNRR